MSHPENQIIDQIRKGNARLYAILVDRYRDRAFTLACRLVKDRHEAEELVQDAFVRAFRSLEGFRGDARFSTWLYRIVYNLGMSRIARKHPGHASLEEREELFHETVPDEESVSSELLEMSEMHDILRKEIEDLPEKYRSAVTLFYLEEMSYDEMTQILDLPLGTVKTNLFRGRNLLRTRLAARLKGELV